MRKRFKYTLLCSALLMLLSSIPVSSINASHKNNIPHKKTTKITHKSPAHHQRISLSKLGQRDAQKDFNKFNGEENYGYLFAHPYYFHNKTFTKAYITKLSKLAKKFDTDPTVDTNINELKVFKHYLSIYQELRGNTRLGFLDTNSNDYIPKNKRNNLLYARGFLLGSMYIDDVNKIYNDTQKVSYKKSPTLTDIEDYYTQGAGHVPATQLINYRKGNIYNNILNLENQSNKNAWTSNQMKYHTRKVMHSLHMNKSLTRQFKDILNPWYVDDYGNSLATTKFASNINRKYPYYHSMYYPKNMDGGRSAGNYEGETIYLHNNKATKKTDKAFRNYMKDYMIYHAGKDCDDTPKNSKTLLNHMKQFTTNYSNQNYKGQNNTPYAQWRLISHKNQKNSSMLYLTPQNGWNYYLVKN